MKRKLDAGSIIGYTLDYILNNATVETETFTTNNGDRFVSVKVTCNNGFVTRECMKILPNGSEEIATRAAIKKIRKHFATIISFNCFQRKYEERLAAESKQSVTTS